MVDDSYAKNKSATLVYLHFSGGGIYNLKIQMKREYSTAGEYKIQGYQRRIGLYNLSAWFPPTLNFFCKIINKGR